MNETSSSGILIKIISAIFILALVDLIFVNWWVLTKSNNLAANGGITEEKIISLTPSPTVEPEGVSENDGDDQNVGKTLTAPSPSPTPVVIPKEKTVIQNQYKEIFIPIGSGKTNSTTFDDINGAEVSIDTGKYGEIDYVIFEGSIWVDGGNGRAWAQIKNLSDNNPLIESQISNPTATPALKSSAKVPLANGSKTYRIQAKTELSEYAAHIDNGRLKIVLK